MDFIFSNSGEDSKNRPCLYKRAECDRSLRDGKSELEQAQTHIRNLDDIIQRRYEDNVEGKISDERFLKMNENYENEQKTLEARVTELHSMITSEQEANANADRFLNLEKNILIFMN